MIIIVIEQCPLTFTGADFYALCSDALLCAMKEEIDRLESLAPQGRILLSIIISIIDDFN